MSDKSVIGFAVVFGIVYLAIPMTISSRRKKKRIDFYMSLGMTKDEAEWEWFLNDSPFTMKF